MRRWQRALSLVGALALVGCAEGVRSSSAAPAPPGLTAATALTEEPDAPTAVLPPTAPPTAELAVVPAPALTEARFHHTATTLADGRVLVVGGAASGGAALSSAEIFDPTLEQWHEAGTGGSPATARTRHTATRIVAGPLEGWVLIAGGHIDGLEQAWSELYDPATDRFQYTAHPLVVARSAHAATALADGRVLITGGYDDQGRAVAITEVFDPATGRFTVASGGQLTTPRAFHTATPLPDGRILIAGGSTSTETGPLETTVSAETVSPAPGGGWSVAPTVPMVRSRAAHTATLLVLDDDRWLVLLVGGSSHEPEAQALDDAEVFDPDRANGVGNFAPLSTRMATARSGHTATVLADGHTVLLIGGATAPHPELCPVTVGIERFVPYALGTAPDAPWGGLTSTALFVQPLGADGTPVGLPETAQGLTAHTAALLADGRVLVAGGADCAFAAPVAVARVALATETAGQ